MTTQTSRKKLAEAPIISNPPGRKKLVEAATISNAPSLWTSRRTAGFLELPLKTLDAWAYTGRGPRYYRVGRHRRYAEADVLCWLEGQVREPRSR